MTLCRLTSVLLAVAALTAAVAAPAGAAIPPGAEYSEAYFPAGDGTMLHADVLRPKGLPADARRTGGFYRALVTARKGRAMLRATTGRVRVPVAPRPRR